MVNRRCRDAARDARNRPRMNAILSHGWLEPARGKFLGAKLPVQRKVFRIEEGARTGAQPALSAREAEDAMRHHEYMNELRALRALIEPRVTNRATMERAR